jgi:peptidoglycan hydrolase-like protein with peptidoglycan-binding domain
MRRSVISALTVTGLVLAIPVATASSASAAAAGAPAAASAPIRLMHGCEPTIRRGSRGIWVERWQHDLQVWGYGYIVQDGVFGTLTERATRDIQRILHIRVDGIVGPQTWSHALSDYC